VTLVLTQVSHSASSHLSVTPLRLEFKVTTLVNSSTERHVMMFVCHTQMIDFCLVAFIFHSLVCQR
jgi:hypothetical protein